MSRGWLAAVVSMLVLAVVAALAACAPATAPDPTAPRSVVALLGRAEAAPCLGFPEDACSQRDTFAPVCAAFAVVHDQQTELVTAAHCVPDGARVLRVFAPSGWGHERAYLLERREAEDIALLAPAEPDAFTPLKVGALPLVGDAVRASTGAGRVTAWLGPTWFEASVPDAPGLSGSPVLDAHGDVVGLLSRCLADAHRRCVPGRTIAAALPRGVF